MRACFWGSLSLFHLTPSRMRATCIRRHHRLCVISDRIDRMTILQTWQNYSHQRTCIKWPCKVFQKSSLRRGVNLVSANCSSLHEYCVLHNSMHVLLDKQSAIVFDTRAGALVFAPNVRVQSPTGANLAHQRPTLIKLCLLPVNKLSNLNKLHVGYFHPMKRSLTPQDYILSGWPNR